MRFDVRLEPGLGDELDGCLCDLWGPVVVFVGGVVVVCVVVVCVVVVCVVGGAAVVVVGVDVVVVVVVVEVVLVVESGAVVEVVEVVIGDVVVVEYVFAPVDTHTDGSSFVIESADPVSAGLGRSAASSLPLVGSSTELGIETVSADPFAK